MYACQPNPCQKGTLHANGCNVKSKAANPFCRGMHNAVPQSSTVPLPHKQPIQLDAWMASGTMITQLRSIARVS